MQQSTEKNETNLTAPGVTALGIGVSSSGLLSGPQHYFLI